MVTSHQCSVGQVMRFNRCGKVDIPQEAFIAALKVDS
jgi:translation elongation factor EF-4